MWREYNPNPCGRRVGDCSIRALTKALNVDWETAYRMACSNGIEMCDMPSSDSVWGSLLRQRGWYRFSIPNYCPECYTVAEFAHDHPEGTYVVGCGGHVVTIRDGVIYDTYDSSGLIAIYYWTKPKGDNTWLTTQTRI